MKERTDPKGGTMDQPKHDLGLRDVQRVPLRLQPGARVYVERMCSPIHPYHLEFVVEDVREDAVLIAYGGRIGESQYRPQHVQVPRYNALTPIPFKSTFDWKASERPPLAIALLDGEPVQLLVGTMPSGTDT